MSSKKACFDVDESESPRSLLELVPEGEIVDLTLPQGTRFDFPTLLAHAHAHTHETHSTASQATSSSSVSSSSSSTSSSSSKAEVVSSS
jgi:hypothetical protein